MDSHSLYMVIVVCPNCQRVSRFVESFESPVPIDQDVTPDAEHCPKCGIQLPVEGYGWDVQEETEVDRVPPAQERQARPETE